MNSNMIVIKCKYKDEIRRIPILNRELTFDELCLMMQRLFKHQLSENTQNMTLKYFDTEGDLISITDDLGS